ncbi:MAG TPA: hypothetical protein VGJ53_05180 [Micromonosporaceae bacterium]
MTTDQDVARYVERVRAALADLPANQREELLEELPDHLAEVAAGARARSSPDSAHRRSTRPSCATPPACPVRTLGG